MILIALAVLMLLLGTCMGAFVGVAVGHWAGQKAARESLEWRRQEWLPVPRLPESSQLVVPELPPSLLSLQGALVTDVTEGSPARRARIRPGDWIFAIDRAHVDSERPLDRLIRDYQPGDTIRIHLMREGQERTITVQLAEHPEDPRVAYLGLFFQMRTAPPQPHDVD